MQLVFVAGSTHHYDDGVEMIFRKMINKMIIKLDNINSLRPIFVQRELVIGVLSNKSKPMN